MSGSSLVRLTKAWVKLKSQSEFSGIFLFLFCFVANCQSVLITREVRCLMPSVKWSASEHTVSTILRGHLGISIQGRGSAWVYTVRPVVVRRWFCDGAVTNFSSPPLPPVKDEPVNKSVKGRKNDWQVKEKNAVHTTQCVTESVFTHCCLSSRQDTFSSSFSNHVVSCTIQILFQNSYFLMFLFLFLNHAGFNGEQ